MKVDEKIKRGFDDLQQLCRHVPIKSFRKPLKHFFNFWGVL